MRHSLLKVVFSTLLLLTAGVVSAYQSVPDIASEPCHEMAMGDMVAEHHLMSTEASDSLSDCDSQCNCCPGSCSSVFTLAGEHSLSVKPGNKALSEQPLASRQAAFFDFLRPPISA